MPVHAILFTCVGFGTIALSTVRAASSQVEPEAKPLRPVKSSPGLAHECITSEYVVHKQVWALA